MIEGIKLEIDQNPDSRDMFLLGEGLSEHASGILSQKGFIEKAIYLKGIDNKIVGGIWGYINWNWLQIALLWISDDLRGKGFGTELMREFEEIGRNQNCEWAHVDTFSFQAREFYESLGYTVFAQLDNYPEGHQRYYLKKKL